MCGNDGVRTEPNSYFQKMIELDQFEIKYEWVPVLRAPNETYCYPGGMPTFFVQTYLPPAIYRWAFFKNSPTPYRAYIGEADSLSQRVRGYLWPGATQQTNLRMKTELEDGIQAGARIELQVVKFRPFVINSVQVTESSLHIGPVRKFLEQFLIADCDQIHCELLNAKQNPIERRLRKAVAGSEK